MLTKLAKRVISDFHQMFRLYHRPMIGRKVFRTSNDALRAYALVVEPLSSIRRHSAADYPLLLRTLSEA